MRDRFKTTRPHKQLGHNLPAIGAAIATAPFLAIQPAVAADDAATQPYHAALTDHVPMFITAPGQTDILFVVVIVMLLVMVLVIGNLYFQLHAIPERVAHGTNKIQMEIVAVLALISLFTHNNIYWIIGLLLAFVRIPDFSTPLYSIARSLARLVNRDPKTDNILPAVRPQPDAAHSHHAHHPESTVSAGQPEPQTGQPAVRAGTQGEGH